MEVVIFVGIHGTTTFYHVYYAATHVRVSKDMIRRTKSKRNIQARQIALIEEALQEDKPVIIDNTSPTTADRTPLITVA